jgi:hypothetical protein
MNNPFRMRRDVLLVCLALFAFLWGSTPVGAQTVDEVAPAPNAIGVSAVAPVEVVLPPGVNPDNVSLRVFGNRAGLYNGDFDFDSDTRTLSFLPDCPLHPGEVISATIRGGGLASTFTWQFTVDAPFGAAAFTEEKFELMEGAALMPFEGEEPELGVLFPAGVYAADLNGTLLSDAVLVNRAAGTLEVLFNTADGFNQQTIGGIDRATNVIAADVTGSGFPDLIANDAVGRSFAVVPNGATERGESVLFGAPFTIETGTRPVKVAAADVTGNGHQDLVVVSFGSDEVYVHPNDGSGEFAQAPEVYPVGASPTDVVVRDFNNDGAPDLAVLSQGDDQVNLLVNDGNGAFDPGTSIDLPFTGATLLANDIAGTDGGEAGDGWMDILVSSQDDTQVAVFPNAQDAATPSFDGEILYQTFSVDAPFDAILADIGFEGDSTLDLITVYPFAGEGTVRWQLNQNNSNFEPTSTSVLATALAPVALDAADFSRDLSLDVVLVNAAGDEVSVLENLASEIPLVCDPGDLLAFGRICIEEEEELLLEVRNRGALPLNVSLTVLGADASAFVPDPDLMTFPLAAEETVEVPITFAPTEGRDYSARIAVEAVEDNEVCSIPEQRVYTKEVELEGTGLEDVLTAAPDPLVFEETVVGETREETFTLTNEGSTDIEIEAFDVEVDAPFTVLTAAGFTVAAGTSTPVDVQFAPDAPGVFDATLLVQTVATCTDEPLSIQLQGEAVPPLPDLLVVDVGADPPLSDPIVGDVYDFEATLENRFAPVEEPFTSRFALTLPNGSVEDVGTFTLESIAEGATRTFESDVVSLAAVGDHTLCFTADVDGEIEEVTEENNQACLSFTVRDPLPDLVATDFALSDPEESLDDVLVSQTRAFACTYENEGEVDAGPFTVRILRGGEEISSRREDSGLMVGDVETLSATILFPSSGLVTVSCVVDDDSEVEEITEDNNRLDLQIDVEQSEDIVVSPNPFTPTGDGFDEQVFFRVSEAGLTAPSLRIFSFEGRQIFSSADLEGGDLFWDGTDDSGNAQRPGVYIYVIQDSNQTVDSGHVTLAR